jgi:hypothetical protein
VSNFNSIRLAGSLCNCNKYLFEQQEFVHQSDNDPKFNKKTGERLLIVLDRLDDEQKADILGKLFRAYMTSQIEEY